MSTDAQKSKIYDDTGGDVALTLIMLAAIIIVIFKQLIKRTATEIRIQANLALFQILPCFLFLLQENKRAFVNL